MYALHLHIFIYLYMCTSKPLKKLLADLPKSMPIIRHGLAFLLSFRSVTRALPVHVARVSC